MSDRKRKHAESSIIKETVSIKRKKISAEAAAIRKNSPKNGKPKKHVERGNTSGRKWKHLRDTKTSTNEVVTMDDEDLDEHTKLLTSVTGKMQRLPLYDDGQSQQREREEGEMKEQVAGVSGEEKGLESKKGVTKEAASQYLQLWNSNRDKWTFKKKTQYWLLQNMFDKKKVCDLWCPYSSSISNRGHSK